MVVWTRAEHICSKVGGCQLGVQIGGGASWGVGAVGGVGPVGGWDEWKEAVGGLELDSGQNPSKRKDEVKVGDEDKW